MNLRNNRRDEAHIDLTSLIDVVFMLLIFFLVTTTFNKDAELSIDLPKAVSKTPENRKDVIEVAIDAEGRYYVNKQQVANSQLDTIKKVLATTMNGDKSKTLIISADAKAAHQSVVTVMDAARQLGLVKLSIATSQTGN